MPHILNIETSTGICSVGISRDGEMLSLRESPQQYDHASQITLLIDACTSEAKLQLNELEAVAVSRGPGSYTALRIGTSVAKAICYTLDIPLIAIDTLQSLAMATYQLEKAKALYIPMIDARRMEVYTAVYDHSGQQLEAPRSLVVTADSFQPFRESGKMLIFSGNGAPKCETVLSSPEMRYSQVECSATHLMPLAEEKFKNQQFEDSAYYEPFYLKPPNITKPKKIL